MGVIKKEQLVRVADNAVFLLDTSSSMNDDLEGTRDTQDPSRDQTS